MLALRIATGVRSHFVTRLPEWLLAGQMGLFGWQLLRTGRTFASSPTYRIMARLCSETAWGGIALGISLFWLLSLILNGSFRWFARWSHWVRSVSALVAFCFWSAAAASMFQANPVSTGVINNAGFAAMAFIVSLITAREVGAADREARHAAARAK